MPPGSGVASSAVAALSVAVLVPSANDTRFVPDPPLASTVPLWPTATATVSAPLRSSARVTVNTAASPSSIVAVSAATVTVASTSCSVTSSSAVTALAPSLTCTVTSYTRSPSASPGFS